MSYGTVVSDAIGSLRQWLRSSNLKPGERIPSERRMMLELGLTHNAANRAMSRLIAEGVVRREGYKLYYGGERIDGTSLTCDLVVGRRSHFIRGYRKVAKALGIGLRVHFYASLHEAIAHLRQLKECGAECVLFDPPCILPVASWAPAMRELLENDIPAVSVGQYEEGLYCVLEDHTRAVGQVFSQLRELGHSELALFTLPPRASAAAEIHDAWLSLPWGAKARTSAKRVAFYEDAREDVQILAQRLAEEWKDVTALVVHSVYEPILPHLLGEMAGRGRSVPKDLSIVALGDPKYAPTCVPAVSAVTFDYPLMHETAFRLAQRLVREKQHIGLLPPPACLRAHPGYSSRASVRSLLGPALGAKTRDKELEEHSGDLLHPESKQALRALLRKPYPLTLAASQARFSAVDIAPFVNRSLNYRKGWFGDLPLAHFAPGRHLVHGVPFDVRGGAKRTDNGAIVFRSRTNERGSSRELPSHVRIPINAKATAVYILHGCGYTRYLSPFASYEFCCGKKKLGEVKMIALGRSRYDWNSVRLKEDSAIANIQDWWGDFPHIDFPGSRQVPIIPPNNDTEVSRCAYLYTLEWKNPHPERTITHMDIKVDTDQSTTLGVIAITILKEP